jgi:hypothetical protein
MSAQVAYTDCVPHVTDRCACVYRLFSVHIFLLTSLSPPFIVTDLRSTLFCLPIICPSLSRNCYNSSL